MLWFRRYLLLPMPCTASPCRGCNLFVVTCTRVASARLIDDDQATDAPDQQGAGRSAAIRTLVTSRQDRRAGLQRSSLRNPYKRRHPFSSSEGTGQRRTIDIRREGQFAHLKLRRKVWREYVSTLGKL